MNVLLHLNPLILLRNVVRDSCSYFPFLVLTCGEVSVAMSYEYLLYFSGIFWQCVPSEALAFIAAKLLISYPVELFL